MTGIALSQRFFSQKRKWAGVKIPSLEPTAACLTQSDGRHHLLGCITWSEFRPYKGRRELRHPFLEFRSCNISQERRAYCCIPAPSLHPSHRTEPCHPQRWFARSRTPGSLWSKTNKFKLSKITGIFPVFASALRRSSFGGGIIPEMGWKRSEHQKLCAICAFSDKRTC